MRDKDGQRGDAAPDQFAHLWRYRGCWLAQDPALELYGRIVCDEGPVNSRVRYSGRRFIDGCEIVDQLIKACRGVVQFSCRSRRYYAQSEPDGE